MTQTTEKHSRISRVGRWVAELVLVFVGVYGAFWLNNYQQHRQDAERRDQILASFEQQLREGIEATNALTRHVGCHSDPADAGEESRTISGSLPMDEIRDVSRSLS